MMAEPWSLITMVAICIAVVSYIHFFPGDIP